MIPTKDLPASVGRICKVSQRVEDLQTIIIVLDSTKMNNPDLDICYSLSDTALFFGSKKIHEEKRCSHDRNCAGDSYEIFVLC